MDITIPANSYGTVYIPADELSQISEGGKQVECVKEIKFLGFADGYAEFEAGSGKYHFEVKGAATNAVQIDEEMIKLGYL